MRLHAVERRLILRSIVQPVRMNVRMVGQDCGCENSTTLRIPDALLGELTTSSKRLLVALAKSEGEKGDFSLASNWCHAMSAQGKE